MLQSSYRRCLVASLALFALMASGCTIDSQAGSGPAATPQAAVKAFLRALGDADAGSLIATLDPAEVALVAPSLESDFSETFAPLEQLAPADLFEAVLQDLLDELGATVTGLDDEAPVYETVFPDDRGRGEGENYARVTPNGLRIAYDRTADHEEVVVVLGRRLQALDPAVHRLELRGSGQGATAWHLDEDGLPVDAYNLSDGATSFVTVERDGRWHVSLRSPALGTMMPMIPPLAAQRAPLARLGEPASTTPIDGFATVAVALDGGTKVAMTRSTWVAVAHLSFDQPTSFITHHESELTTSAPQQRQAWAVVFDNQYDVAFPALGAITRSDLRIDVFDVEPGEVLDGYVGEIGADGRPQLFRWEWTSEHLDVSGADHVKLVSGNGNTVVMLDASNGTGEDWGNIVAVWGEPGATFEFSLS